MTIIVAVSSLWSRAIVLRAPIASHFDSPFTRQLIEMNADRIQRGKRVIG